MQDVVLRATVLAQDGAELTLRVEEVIHPRTPLEAGDQIRVGRHPAHEQHRPGQLTIPDGLRPACDAQTGQCTFAQVEQPGAVESR